jgi:hypothetical protein
MNHEHRRPAVRLSPATDQKERITSAVVENGTDDGGEKGRTPAEAAGGGRRLNHTAAGLHQRSTGVSVRKVRGDEGNAPTGCKCKCLSCGARGGWKGRRREDFFSFSASKPEVEEGAMGWQAQPKSFPVVPVEDGK